MIRFKTRLLSVGRGEVDYGPMIWSQSFNESVLLSCGHQKCFSICLPCPLGETGWLERLQLGISLLLGQLGCDNTPAGLAQFNQFPLRAGIVKNRVLWSISKGFIFASLCQKPKGISPLYCGNPMKLQEVSITVWGIPLEILTLRLFCQWFLWQFLLVNLWSDKPWLPEFTCFSNLGAGVCPVYSPLLRTQEEFLPF